MATPKSKGADHVVLQGEEMVCLHCGRRQRMAFPIDLAVFAAAGKAYSAKHRHCKPDPAVAAAEEQRRADAAKDPMSWIMGPDTGISSITIWHVMTGRPWTDADFRPNVPHDPSDFGRCHRLLQAFPSWRPRLPEVAALYPKWGPMVREWDRMTALYEEELKRPDGRAPELYALMKQLEGEGFEAIGQANPYKRER